MMSLKIYQESKTTLRSSQHLMPLLIITGLAVLTAVSVFGLMFYPAQDRLAEIGSRFQAAQQTQTKTQTAQHTQGIIDTTWHALSDYQEFTSFLAKLKLLRREKLRLKS